MFKFLLSVFLFSVFFLSIFAASILDNPRDYKVKTEEFLPIKTFRNYLTINKNTLIFAGDVMIGRSVQTKALNNGSVHYPFLKTSEFLSSADI
ncbi:MAG: CapA family protein, partial [Patescibacteria group bacterium]|nr:CapA family protein [Patescibacteria group bacterium]